MRIDRIPSPAIGTTHGRLTVIGRIPDRRDRDGHLRAYILVRCACGVERGMREAVFRKGSTVSCGCWHLENKRTHRLSGTRIFRIWHSMHSRCAGRNTRTFKDYAGRGIAVCERWSGPEGLRNFFDDMGEPPAGMSLDRINNDGNYEPGNCRWATNAEQNRNMRSNVFVIYDGKQMCLSDACAAAGIKLSTVSVRLGRTGMAPQLAFDFYVAYSRGI